MFGLLTNYTPVSNILSAKVKCSVDKEKWVYLQVLYICVSKDVV